MYMFDRLYFLLCTTSLKTDEPPPVKSNIRIKQSKELECNNSIVFGFYVIIFVSVTDGRRLRKAACIKYTRLFKGLIVFTLRKHNIDLCFVQYRNLVNK